MCDTVCTQHTSIHITELNNLLLIQATCRVIIIMGQSHATPQSSSESIISATHTAVDQSTDTTSNNTQSVNTTPQTTSSTSTDNEYRNINSSDVDFIPSFDPRNRITNQLIKNPNQLQRNAEHMSKVGDIIDCAANKLLLQPYATFIFGLPGMLWYYKAPYKLATVYKQLPALLCVTSGLIVDTIRCIQQCDTELDGKPSQRTLQYHNAIRESELINQSIVNKWNKFDTVIPDHNHHNNNAVQQSTPLNDTPVNDVKPVSGREMYAELLGAKDKSIDTNQQLIDILQQYDQQYPDEDNNQTNSYRKAQPK